MPINHNSSHIITLPFIKQILPIHLYIICIIQYDIYYIMLNKCKDFGLKFEHVNILISTVIGGLLTDSLVQLPMHATRHSWQLSSNSYWIIEKYANVQELKIAVCLLHKIVAHRRVPPSDGGCHRQSIFQRLQIWLCCLVVVGQLFVNHFLERKGGAQRGADLASNGTEWKQIWIRKWVIEITDQMPEWLIKHTYTLTRK